MKKEITKQLTYRELLAMWEKLNYYKTVTARNAVERYANWLDKNSGYKKVTKEAPRLK